MKEPKLEYYYDDMGRESARVIHFSKNPLAPAALMHMSTKDRFKHTANSPYMATINSVRFDKKMATN